MIYLIYAFVGLIIGLIIGGVINLLADDLPARRSPSLPHCHADECRHRYSPKGWLALGRFLLYGGQCPTCEQPERKRPIIIELVTALTWGLLPLFVSTVNLAEFLIIGVYLSILILVIVIDVEHKLILHVVTVPTTLIAILGLSWFLPDNNLQLAALGAVTGFVMFFFFFWIGERFFGAGALGFGDVTLSMTMGAMLGFKLIIPTLVIGILIGGILSGLLLVFRIVNRNSYVPYGPFLATAGMIMLVWGEPILEWYFS
ncbi:MAG: leader peptidase (prepilin peptidase)/N-methyltransferase [Cellvibrionaceae bacterium]|jgi:leader peptidase (prepilin peptidase)/N-methyltransferase